MNRDEKFRRRAEDAPNRILDRLKVGDRTSDQLRWFLENGDPIIVGAVTYRDGKFAVMVLRDGDMDDWLAESRWYITQTPDRNGTSRWRPEPRAGLVVTVMDQRRVSRAVVPTRINTEELEA